MHSRVLIGTCLLLLSVGMAGASVAGTSQEVSDSLKDTLFKDTDEALARANEVRANLLAPTSYSEAAEFYRRAESTLASGGDIDTIQRYLQRARESFQRAREASQVAAVAFEKTLKARQDAEQAESSRYAKDDWRKAVAMLNEAAIKLEKDRVKSAQRSADKATTLFRAAELTAIKANYLNETRKYLNTADDLRADRYAPISFEKASKLLGDAESELNSNRYDTDRPRNLAQLAEHNARHAIYVSKLADKLRDGEISLEQILLDWETSIEEVADQIDVPVYFDEGQKDAINEIKGRISTQQSQFDSLTQNLSDRDAQIAALNAELTDLHSQLGGQSRSLANMNSLLAKQQLQREKFFRVENMFTQNQATVLRKGNNVILRMIGLNFDSGKADLKPSHFQLLTVVKEAIAEFSDAKVVVEGHTDSFGSDELNLALSQARADAVLQYLLANTPIQPTNITAIGYGESRPVANNETPEGRTRNRRIDIVIYPSW